MEVLRTVAGEAGLTLKITTVPWSRAMQYIKTGEIDLMLNITRTDDREQFMDVIGICSYEQMVLIVKKDNLGMDLTSIEDLTTFPQKKFGLQKDYYYPQLTERLKQDKTFHRYFQFSVNSEINIKKTLGNRIWGFFDDKFFAVYATKMDPAYKNLGIHPFALNDPQPVNIVASRKTDLLKRNQLKQTHKRLMENGTIRSIIDKWSR